MLPKILVYFSQKIKFRTNYRLHGIPTLLHHLIQKDRCYEKTASVPNTVCITDCSSIECFSRALMVNGYISKMQISHNFFFDMIRTLYRRKFILILTVCRKMWLCCILLKELFNAEIPYWKWMILQIWLAYHLSSPLLSWSQCMIETLRLYHNNLHINKMPW